MEIDFLGLNTPSCELEQEKSNNSFLDAGGGLEISLSLSTTSSLNFSERKKWEFAACEKMISSSSSSSCSVVEKTEQAPGAVLLVAPPVFRHPTGGFLYDINHPLAAVNSRNMSQLSNEPAASLAMLYPTCPNVFAQPEKAKAGHTPTVAMARRATLVRFLEKRLHRMNQLEKEAFVKGVPIGKSIDIEIPPPRPKRKPNNPYPRKTGVGTPVSQVEVKDGKIPNPISSTCQSKVTMALEIETKEPCEDEQSGNRKAYHDKDNCSEAFTTLQTAPFESPSSAYKIDPVSDAPKESFSHRQYIPLSREATNQDESAASQVTTEAHEFQMEKSDSERPFHNLNFKVLNVFDPYLLQEKSLHTKKMDELNQSGNDTLRNADVQAPQNYPRHVPVHILDGSLGMRAFNVSPDMSYADPIVHQMGGVHAQQNLFTNPAASATSERYSNASKSSVHQSFTGYHPFFAPVQSQYDHQSFLHIPPPFSSLIISALSQNPAAYAAASFAASLWPSLNVESSVEPSSASDGPFQSRPISTTPSTAAIAAATVAAATAWWAAHGQIPLCAPYQPGFNCSPASASAAPMFSSKDRAVNSARRERSPVPALGGQQLEPECSEALAVSKSPRLLSSDSEESESAKLNVGLATAETEKVKAVAEPKDADTSKSKKLVDRSSCGSNTTSSSEVEANDLEKHTKGKEEKHIKDKEEPEEPDAMHSAGDPFGRRSRSTGNGRLAFDALFSREVLPQSFSPPYKCKKNCNKESEEGENGAKLNLNERTGSSCSQKKGEANGKNTDEGALNTDLGLGHGKLKACRTGFKPYKRCSVEAKEFRVTGNGQDEEKGTKRLRVEGESLC